MSTLIFPLILIVGVMFIFTRQSRSKQRQALQMRSEMEPGTGVRTIGGMYAVVKEVNDETVLLELTDGVHAHFAKNAIGSVLSEDEFNRIVHGIEPEELDESPESEDADADSDTADADAGDVRDVDLAKDVDLTKDGESAKDGDDHEGAKIDLGKSGTPSEQDGSDSRSDSK